MLTFQQRYQIRDPLIISMGIKRAAGDQNTGHALKVLDLGYLPTLLRNDEPRVRLDAQRWVMTVARLDKVTM